MKKILTFFLTLLICIIFCFTILLGSFSIPTKSMIEHVEESKEVLKKEGLYPTIHNNDLSSTLDNFTDSLMLLAATNNHNENLLNRSMAIYLPADTFSEDPLKILTTIDLNKKTNDVKYDRYWHGYLSLLKPLLCIFNYQQIRIINFVVQTLLLGLLCYRMYKKGLKKYIIPLLLCFMLLKPLCVYQSIQYSSVYYICLISIHILISKFSVLNILVGSNKLPFRYFSGEFL